MKIDPAVVERLRSVIKSAKRLNEDALLLTEHGRFSSGYALALLSIEEIGKILIELWKEDTYWRTPSPPEVRSGRLNFHVRKQVAFTTLLFAGEVMRSVSEVADEELDADRFRAIYSEAFDRAEGSGLLIDAMFGVMNRSKESAFYADGSDSVQRPDVPANEVRVLLDRHSEAIELLADWRVMSLRGPPITIPSA